MWSVSCSSSSQRPCTQYSQVSCQRASKTFGDHGRLAASALSITLRYQRSASAQSAWSSYDRPSWNRPRSSACTAPVDSARATAWVSAVRRASGGPSRFSPLRVVVASLATSGRPSCSARVSASAAEGCASSYLPYAARTRAWMASTDAEPPPRPVAAARIASAVISRGSSSGSIRIMASARAASSRRPPGGRGVGRQPVLELFGQQGVCPHRCPLAGDASAVSSNSCARSRSTDPRRGSASSSRACSKCRTASSGPPTDMASRPARTLASMAVSSSMASRACRASSAAVPLARPSRQAAAYAACNRTRSPGSRSS